MDFLTAFEVSFFLASKVIFGDEKSCRVICGAKHKIAKQISMLDSNEPNYWVNDFQYFFGKKSDFAIRENQFIGHVHNKVMIKPRVSRITKKINTYFGVVPFFFGRDRIEWPVIKTIKI
jgi:hypothetical protein